MGRSDDRPRLPTGTVTFLFTDIEGSTRLLQDLGDRYGAVRDEHAVILRRAIRDGGGVEVSTEGDSIFAALASPVGRSGRRWPPSGRRCSLQPPMNDRCLDPHTVARSVGQVYVSNVGGSWPYGWNRSAVSCGTYLTCFRSAVAVAYCGRPVGR